MCALDNLTSPPKRWYRPAVRLCPSCKSVLKRGHLKWRKELIFLTGRKIVGSWVYSCPNQACKPTPIASAYAESWHLKHRRYSREVIVAIGYRRFWYHQTVDEIHTWLSQDLGLPSARRQILNLIGDFLALLRAGQPAQIRNKIHNGTGLVVGLDGMQPEKGNRCLYVAREAGLGLTLIAELLIDSENTTISRELLEPLKILVGELSANLNGVISDGQDSLRVAVAKTLSNVPHQIGQFHTLRNAGSLTFKADRSMKKKLKASYRKLLARVERRIEALASHNPYRVVLADYALAIRTTLLVGGIAPFDLGGLRVFDSLEAVANSLKRCQAKGDHYLLQQLITVVDKRFPFIQEAQQLHKQLQWLIELERRFDVLNDPNMTSEQVKQTVEKYIKQLKTDTTLTSQEKVVVHHIEKTLRHMWWGLFTCYDVDGLPRTNNELEGYFRRIKSGQRRITGRKKVHEFIIRYGPYVTYIDYAENEQELLNRLQQVTHEDFLAERTKLNTLLLREQKRIRFRLRQDIYLQKLEVLWAKAVEQT